MKRILFSSAFLLFLISVTGQDITTADGIVKMGTDSILKKRTYKATLTLTDNSVHKGFLVHLSDSGILFSQFPFPLQSDNYWNPTNSYSYHDLETLRLQQKGSGVKGLVFGMLTGLTIGAISGFAAGSDPDRIITFRDPFFGNTDYFTVRGTSALEKAVLLGFLGMAGGAVIGATIGLLTHRKFTIKGKRQNFLNMKSRMMSSLYYSPH
jgi:hypothetical protein